MEFLNHLDDTALFDKSARHFMDALLKRKWRNDVDYHGRGIFHLCLFIQQNSIFSNLLTLSTWVYVGIAFIEPSQLYDINAIDMNLTEYSDIIELVILCLFGINFILEALLLISMYNYHAVIRYNSKNCIQRFLYIIFYENLMSTCILVSDALFFSDYIVYRVRFPYQMFRYTRLLRPCRLLVKQ